MTSRPPQQFDSGAQRSLDRLVAANLGWGLLNQISTRAVLGATGIILARILSPADYGVYAVAIIVMELLLGINDLGLITAITRYQGDVACAARTATSLTAVSSTILYAVCFATAPLIAAALNIPGYATVLRVAALVVFVDAVCAAPAALLTRAFRQDLRAAAEVTGLVAYAAVSILLAERGGGVWSLVWGRMVGSALTAALIILVAPIRPLPGFDREHARELLRFGLPLAGAGMLSLLVLNLDYMIVGRLLGPAQLGLYVVAFSLCTWPFQLVFLAVQRVAVVGFARLADAGPALSAGFNRSLTLLAAAVAPACLFIGLLAGPLVRVVYGERWSPAADALRFLAIFGGVRVVEGLIENFLAGVGRSLATVWITAAWFGSLLPAVLIGARIGGIQGVGVAHAAVAALVVLPLALLITRPSGIDVRPCLGHVVRLTIAGLMAVVAAVLVERALPGDLPRLLGAGAAIAVTYLAVALSWPALRALLPSARTGVAVAVVQGSVPRPDAVVRTKPAHGDHATVWDSR